jgi:cbb3-type cytochrome oxidase maturation protein
MNVMFILIGASLLLAIGFLIAFFWAVRDGQFDDTYTPSVRILFDNEKESAQHKSKSSN